MQHRAEQRARADRRQPLRRRRPRHVAGGRNLGDGRHIHAHRPGPKRTHRQRHRQCHPLVGLLAQRAESLCYLHIRDIQDPGGIEGLQQAGRGDGDFDVWGGHAARRPWSSRSDSATTSSGDGSQPNTPAGWPPDDRGVDTAHAPHEQVQHPAEVAPRIVVRLSPAQKAMQHSGIQQRLQRIVRVQHRLGQTRKAVVGGGVAQQVRLVVHHQVSLLGQAQHYVDRTRQVPAQRLTAQVARRQSIGIGGQRVIAGQM